MWNIAVVAFVIGYFLLIWFRTNAFAEYIILCKQTYFYKIKEYTRLHSDGYDGNYIDFLTEYYKDKFLVRLLVCPVCVSFWLGVVSMIVSRSFESFIIAPLSLLFYFLFNKLF
jgi:hypothetical protein